MGNPRKANGARRRHVVRWLRSQGRPCWICGLPIDYGVPPGNPGAFECDELVPVSRGGSPFDRDNVAAYADVEIPLTEKLTVEGAVRFEDYSDFGSQFSGKLSLRYAFTDKVALRGTAATGFCAMAEGVSSVPPTVT